MKLIGDRSNRKSPKVLGVFNIMDEKGMSTLKNLVDDIREQRLSGMGIITKKSKAKAKAKAKDIKHEFALGGPFAPGGKAAPPPPPHNP